jgi:hypothetical protein
MAATWVQSKGASSSGTTASIGATFDSDVGSGSFIAVGVSLWIAGTYTITDGQSNTYTEDVTNAVGNASGRIARAFTGSAGALTVTLTNTSGNKYTSIGIAEFTGVDSTDTLEGTASTDDAGTTHASGSITPAANGALFIGCMAHGESGSPTLTVDSPGSLVYEYESSANQPISLSYYIQTTAGPQSMDWTSGASIAASACMAAAYNAATGGGGGSTTHWNLLLLGVG